MVATVAANIATAITTVVEVDIARILLMVVVVVSTIALWHGWWWYVGHR